uniref:Delta-like protein n=1 Tax=Angiostrongylus cantonensis TaxID=6313 RepID=A0A0K0DMD9_ANGCA
MKRQHVRYCFTELPYHYHKTSDDLCLKSGQFTVTNRTDTVLHFRIANLTTAYLTIAFDISDANGGADEEKSQKLSYRSVIDGSRPAQRIAVANGLIFDFITICNRPYYGLMCAHYCAYAAGDHHICDSSGKKVCLLGWTGKDCAIATGDVLNTRIDDITTPSPTKASSSKSTAARETRRQCGFFTVRSAAADDIVHDYWISGQKIHAIIMDAEPAE